MDPKAHYPPPIVIVREDIQPSRPPDPPQIHQPLQHSHPQPPYRKEHDLLSQLLRWLSNDEPPDKHAESTATD